MSGFSPPTSSSLALSTNSTSQELQSQTPALVSAALVEPQLSPSSSVSSGNAKRRAVSLEPTRSMNETGAGPTSQALHFHRHENVDQRSLHLHVSNPQVDVLRQEASHVIQGVQSHAMQEVARASLEVAHLHQQATNEVQRVHQQASQEGMNR